MSEEWADIPGYEGRYQVSDIGRIRSVARLVNTLRRDGSLGKRWIKSKVLAQHTWGAKYPGVVLCDADGIGARWMTHQLVAMVFVPNPAGHTYINHIDSNKSNPARWNLEWCSQSDNLRHAHRVGMRKVGADHHFAKLPRDALGRCLPAKKDGGGFSVEAV